MVGMMGKLGKQVYIACKSVHIQGGLPSPYGPYLNSFQKMNGNYKISAPRQYNFILITENLNKDLEANKIRIQKLIHQVRKR